MATNADIYRLRGSTLTQVASNVSPPYQDPNRQENDVYIPVPVGESPQEYIPREQETVTRINNVEGDGGFVADKDYLDNLVVAMKNDGIFSNLDFLVGPSLGVKTNSGNAEKTYWNFSNSKALTGSNTPSYNASASALNSNHGLLFSEDLSTNITSPDVPTYTNPVTAIIILKRTGSGGNNQIFESDGNITFKFSDAFEDWRMRNGGSLSTGTADDQLNLFVLEYDGANANMIQNGTTVASGDVGTRTGSGLNLGLKYWDGWVATFLRFEGLFSDPNTANTVTTIANRFGITI